VSLCCKTRCAHTAPTSRVITEAFQVPHILPRPATQEQPFTDIEMPGQYVNGEDLSPDNTVMLAGIGSCVPVVRKHSGTSSLYYPALSCLAFVSFSLDASVSVQQWHVLQQFCDPALLLLRPSDTLLDGGVASRCGGTAPACGGWRFWAPTAAPATSSCRPGSTTPPSSVRGLPECYRGQDPERSWLIVHMNNPRWLPGMLLVCFQSGGPALQALPRCKL